MRYSLSALILFFLLFLPATAKGQGFQTTVNPPETKQAAPKLPLAIPPPPAAKKETAPPPPPAVKVTEPPPAPRPKLDALAPPKPPGETPEASKIPGQPGSTQGVLTVLNYILGSYLPIVQVMAIAIVIAGGMSVALENFIFRSATKVKEQNERYETVMARRFVLHEEYHATDSENSSIREQIAIVVDRLMSLNPDRATAVKGLSPAEVAVAHPASQGLTVNHGAEG